jgi:cell fate (sporulation/competence/biofilm development) regulator YlbF (YheA/YmcA/DUF963 family)
MSLDNELLGKLKTGLEEFESLFSGALNLFDKELSKRLSKKQLEEFNQFQGQYMKLTVEGKHTEAAELAAKFKDKHGE